MSNKMEPTTRLYNVFGHYIENQFFNQYTGGKPEPYGRHMDDCVGATSASKNDLNQFIQYFRQFCSPGT